MTTGPENYRKAQVLLTDAEENFSPGDPGYLALATAAGALATLALAAATALGHREVPAGDEDSFSTSSLPYDDYTAWWEAASEGPAARQRREEAARAEREEVMDGLRAARRDTRETSTSQWFHDAVSNGCTGTSYDPDWDIIIHEDAPPCPVHEPGDVVPVEDRLTPRQAKQMLDDADEAIAKIEARAEEGRLTPQPGLYRDAHGRQHEKPYGAGF